MHIIDPVPETKQREQDLLTLVRTKLHGIV